MIHIVEIKENNHAKVWFAFDEDDFIRKVQADYSQQADVVIYQQTTAQQLQNAGNTSPETIRALSEQYEAETPIFRADYLLGEGIYQAEPVSALRASLAAIASNADFRIYSNDEDAAEELDREPLFKSREGFEAGRKLRAHLVEMEVIAEDF